MVPGSSHCWQWWHLLLDGARGAAQSHSTPGTLCAPSMQPLALSASGRSLSRENALALLFLVLQPPNADCWLTAWLRCCSPVPRCFSLHPQPCCLCPFALGMAAPLFGWGSSLAQKMCRTSRQPWTLCCCLCALCWDDVGPRAGIGTVVQHWQHVAQAEGSLSTSSIMDSKQRKGRITHKRKVLISQRLITQDCLRFKPSNFR